MSPRRTALGAVLVVARREVVQRGRRRAFRTSTVALVLLVVAAALLPTLLTGVSQSRTVVVVRDARSAAVVAATEAAGRQAGVEVTARQVADRRAAVAEVASGEADVAVVGTAELVWPDEEDATLSRVVVGALTQTTLAERAAALGLDPQQLTSLLAPVKPSVTVLPVEPGRGPRGVLAYLGMVALFAAISFYGSWVLMGVVEEKSSRVVEVLLARISPAQLLAGKVLGIGLLGLAQLLVVAAAAVATLRVVQPPDVPATTPGAVATVLVWFVLGYGFYSVLYGALGSMASRVEDAQAAVAPLTGFLLFVYLGAFLAAVDPTAWWVTAGSLLPPTAPLFLPMRAALVDVPAWQVVLAAGLTAAATVGLVAVGGRLYRGAVLRLGGRVRLRDAWRGEPAR